MNSKFGSIIFPTGLAGNHLRWLLFVDDRITSPFSDQSPYSKIEFIKKNIYNENRTWNNWLSYEWQYRTQLDGEIDISHNGSKMDLHTEGKELYLSCDNTKLPSLHYFHINLGLNCMTPKDFVMTLKGWSTQGIKSRIAQYENKKVISCEPMFQPVLSPDWYVEVVEFFGFSNNYFLAQEVHKLHYNCRMKSARDFYDFFTSPEYADWMTEIKLLGYGKEI